MRRLRNMLGREEKSRAEENIFSDNESSDGDSVTDDSTPVAVRKGSMFGEVAQAARGALSRFATQQLSPVADAETATAVAKPRPKSEQELERERLQRLAVAEAERLEVERREQVRLENEPSLAKKQREVFANAYDILVLFNAMFISRRFGHINDPEAPLYLQQLNAEIESDFRKQESLSQFKKWHDSTKDLHSPIIFHQVIEGHPAVEDVNLLTQWGEKLTSLSALWEEVFQYYVIASGHRYPFSLQPLEKLRSFCQALNSLRDLGNGFDAYMKSDQYHDQAFVSPENGDKLNEFIRKVELFSARAMVLYVLLQGIKNAMECNEKSRRQLNPQLALSEEIVLTVVDNKKKPPKEIPEILIRDLALKALGDNTALIVGYQSQLEYYGKDLSTYLQEYNDAKIALANAEKQLPLVQEQFDKANADAEAAIANIEVERVKVAEREKIESIEEAKHLETAAQRRQLFVENANKNALRFLTDYLTQPGAKDALTFSTTIQCFLPAVSDELLRVWIADQQAGMTDEEAKWLSTLIVPAIRTLTVRLKTTSRVELVLADTGFDMLQDLSISLDGVPRSNLATAAGEFVSEKINLAYKELLRRFTETKAPSPESARAVKQLQAIRAAQIEHHPRRDELAYLYRDTFALFGLFMLLYLQDAPDDNFKNKKGGATSFPGGGGRFVWALMATVQEELGYRLQTAKVVYDVMNPKESLASTLRSSLLGRRSSVGDEKESSSSNRISNYFSFLFDNTTNSKMLELKVGQKAAMNLSSAEYDELVLALMEPRNVAALREIATSESLTELDRKRMKRVMELMQQLPYEKRLTLIAIPAIQLLVLREQIESYQRDVAGVRGSAAGKAAATLTRFVKKSNPKKPEKLAFLQCVFNEIKRQLDEAPSPVARARSESTAGGSLVFDAYRTIKKTTSVAKDEVDQWVYRTILHGDETVQALSWLPVDRLNQVFDGTDCSAATILQRELIGQSLKSGDFDRFSQIVATEEDALSHSDIKFMDVTIEIMSELSSAKRAILMESSVIQLLVLKQQIHSFESTLDSGFGGAAKALYSFAGKELKKEWKIEFLRLVFASIKSGNFETGNTQSFIHYARICIAPKNSGKVLDWLKNHILNGSNTKARLAWLPTAVLERIFADSGVVVSTFFEKSAVIEEGDDEDLVTEETAVEGRSVHEVTGITVDSDDMQAQKLFVQLALQAAVLEFAFLTIGEGIEAESFFNGKQLAIASQGNWFLKLRFIEALIVEEGIYDLRTPNYTRERNMLKVIGNMMDHVSELAGWMTSYFSKTYWLPLRDEIIPQTPRLLMVKLAFVLVSEFFHVLFKTLAGAAKKGSSDANTFGKIAEFFNEIKQEAGFTLNGEYEALLFGLAVNFLSANQALLQNSCIEICEITDGQALLMQGQAQSVVSDKSGERSLDSSFFSSAAVVTLVRDTKANEVARLSHSKTTVFFNSVKLQGLKESDGVERLQTAAGHYPSRRDSQGF